jgi:hypothetical protein
MNPWSASVSRCFTACASCCVALVEKHAQLFFLLDPGDHDVMETVVTRSYHSGYLGDRGNPSYIRELEMNSSSEVDGDDHTKSNHTEEGTERVEGGELADVDEDIIRRLEALIIPDTLIVTSSDMELAGEEEQAMAAVANETNNEDLTIDTQVLQYEKFLANEESSSVDGVLSEEKQLDVDQLPSTEGSIQRLYR